MEARKAQYENFAVREELIPCAPTIVFRAVLFKNRAEASIVKLKNHLEIAHKHRQSKNILQFGTSSTHHGSRHHHQRHRLQ